MAVAGVEDIRTVGQLEGEHLADGVFQDKAGEPYLQRVGQGLGKFVFRVQLAGEDLAYILEEQQVIEQKLTVLCQVDADAGATGHGPYAAAGRHLPEGCCLADNGELVAVADTGALIIGGAGGNDDLAVHKEAQVVGRVSGFHQVFVLVKQEQLRDGENIGRHICLKMVVPDIGMQFFLIVVPFHVCPPPFVSCPASPIIVNAGACRKSGKAFFGKLG